MRVAHSYSPETSKKPSPLRPSDARPGPCSPNRAARRTPIVMAAKAHALAVEIKDVAAAFGRPDDDFLGRVTSIKPAGTRITCAITLAGTPATLCATRAPIGVRHRQASGRGGIGGRAERTMKPMRFAVRRGSRRTALLVLLISGLARCSGTSDDAIPHSALRPNVRGADIRVVADSGEHDPAPIVVPAAPLHLVIDDCRDFVLFPVPDTNSDPDSGVVVLNWHEPPERQRSLTILARSPSCASHAGVQRLLEVGGRIPSP